MRSSSAVRVCANAVPGPTLHKPASRPAHASRDRKRDDLEQDMTSPSTAISVARLVAAAPGLGSWKARDLGHGQSRENDQEKNAIFSAWVMRRIGASGSLAGAL